MKAIVYLAIICVMASPANAGTRWTTLPPTQYDVPYTGELTIWITDKKNIGEHCAKVVVAPSQSWAGIACSFFTKSRSRCIIYIVRDDVLRAAGYHPIGVLRHEIGHCNGWGSDHAGSRPISGNEPVAMPELPKTTRTIKAYSLPLCLKPDGTEEPCASRAL
jgi:hypothetical protein